MKKLNFKFSFLFLLIGPILANRSFFGSMSCSSVEIINKLEEILKGKIRRTKEINLLISNIIEKCVSLYQKNEELKLECFSSEIIRKMLEDCYKNLKNLKEIHQFTSLLLFIDNNFHMFIYHQMEMK